MAPSMRSVETQYRDRINFISVDGSNSKNGMMKPMINVSCVFKSVAEPVFDIILTTYS